jgi:hypothetical protein
MQDAMIADVKKWIVSASRGKLFGSMATVHLAYAETAPVPGKTTVDRNVLRHCADTVFGVSLCSDMEAKRKALQAVVPEPKPEAAPTTTVDELGTAKDTIQ